MMLESAVRREVMPISCEIIFQKFQPMSPYISTLQTDGRTGWTDSQTDGHTTCHSTASHSINESVIEHKWLNKPYLASNVLRRNNKPSNTDRHELAQLAAEADETLFQNILHNMYLSTVAGQNATNLQPSLKKT